MNKQYFNKEFVSTLEPSFWFMLKLRLFGEKITEHSGKWEMICYMYKDVIYMTKYGPRI